MSIALGVLVGAAVAAALAVVWRSVRSGQANRTPEAVGMQSALHAATSTLPHLRGGLNAHSAENVVPHLRALTGAAAIAVADPHAVLAIEGDGRDQVRPGDLLSRLLERTPDDRLHVVPRLVSSDPGSPLRSAGLAPLILQGRRAGTLRCAQEAASLVSAQLELSVVREQEERLAQAELRALRAQISPHFIYNALAAVAGDIHARPEEARELLIDFAEFTRYLFRDGRPYVTVADELAHVERYLRLEQARFRDRLHISFAIPPETRAAVVPSLSIQPLVENAVRHGVERGGDSGAIAIEARVTGGDVELRVSDDGSGIEPERVPALLAGAGGGIGLANVDARLRATFGDRYALQIESRPGRGTTVVMTVPNLAGGEHDRASAPTLTEAVK